MFHSKSVRWIAVTLLSCAFSAVAYGQETGEKDCNLRDAVQGALKGTPYQNLAVNEKSIAWIDAGILELFLGEMKIARAFEAKDANETFQGFFRLEEERSCKIAYLALADRAEKTVLTVTPKGYIAASRAEHPSPEFSDSAEQLSSGEAK